MVPATEDEIHRLVVHGCGPLAWARWQESAHMETGRWREMVDVDSGLEISLGEVVDRPWGWLPAEELPRLRIEIHHGGGVEAPLLPDWPELVAVQARSLTSELRGTGVLATPESWRESPKGRQLLQAWNAEGWQWAALEQILKLRFGDGLRLAVPAGAWVRIHQGKRRVTMPNGAEAALALQLAEPILERLLKSVDGPLVQRWWNEEQGHSGWFLRQRISHLLAQALRQRASSVELGAKERAIFAFSSLAARDTFQELAGLRLTVDLPAPSASWWRQVGRPGFLRPPQGRRGRFGATWEDSETLVLEHPADELEDRPELKQLREHLHFNSLPYQTEDPARLVQAWDLAQDLSPWLARTLAEDEERRQAVHPETSEGSGPESKAAGEESAPPPENRPAPIGDPLALEFEPRICRLDTPHRPASVRIWRLNEVTTEPAFSTIEPEPGKVIYQVDEDLPHGAVIRIDYDPLTPRGRGA